jgi:hypothetical protein
MAFVRCDECVPPKVLAPQFTARQLRQLKRWVRGHPAAPAPALSTDLEILGIALADRAGCETVNSGELASAFVEAFREDFDAVLRLECGERTAAALAGDLAVQLGLRLEGTLEQNLERLREFCEPRRLLFVLEDVRGAESLELAFHGRCSTLISTAPAAAPTPDPLREAQAAMREMHAGWTDLCAHARQGRQKLRDGGRMAELYEMMGRWHDAAESRGDMAVLDESARELVWILEGWGMTEEARRLDYRRASAVEDQMLFRFD